ncbi:MAG TPA: UvrD-helicase domain-containing protein [Candidatus Dormibacteraeota bacterium]|nr:UvrD-helicase domain-containing protein [Candidatus Dormibacteraeota bacterium]
MDLDTLNDPQRQAVTHRSGPLLILAGAGSGKTRVLTMRIANLIHHGVAADRILALTFTNKAAREMRTRLKALLGKAPDGLWVGTFHAIATRMLRPHADRLGYRAGFTIFDEDDSRSILKRALAELDLDPKKHQVAGLLAAISRAKAEARSPEDITGRKAADRALRMVYERYQALSRDSNGMDFDDLLLNLVQLLKNDAGALQEWRDRFDHVLVDEYQDTNRVQYELLRLLCDGHRNLAVVGDDDQSIYAFRGADVRNILDFERDYTDATVVKLEQNYRSTQAILDVAHSVICRNQERTQKRLWTSRGEGRRPVLLLAPDDGAEAAFVGDEILALEQSEGWLHSDFAILYRTNAQSRAFEKALMARRIPYNLVGGLRFWDRREVKDAVAYLRFLANPSDAVSFDRIANVPKRRISEKTAQAAIAAASDGGVSILDVCGTPTQVPVRPEAQEALLAFHAQVAPLVADVGRRKAHELIQLLIRRCNLGDHYDDGTPAGRNRLDNLVELRELAQQYERYAPAKGLERFLTDIALTAGADEVDGKREQVTLITLHMAKGLEYPVVFLTGLEDKLLPHERAFEEAGGLDEERRLCYVGITRAQRRLYLTVASVRTIFAKTVALASSQFLHDVPPAMFDLVELEGHRSHGIAARVRKGSIEATA